MTPLDSFPQKTKPVRALAFDYGTQRIGVAFGQSLTGTAQAVGVLRARDGVPDWEEIATLIERWQPDAFVVGLPFNLDGSESPLLLRAVKFGHRLNGKFHKPSYGFDERLSSIEAAERVLESGLGARLSSKRSRGKHDGSSAIDDVAAQIILENWLGELLQRKLA